MRQNMPDVHFLRIEMNRRNDPVLVAPNVKHIERADFIGGIERRLDIGKTQKLSRLNNLAPSLQWNGSLRVHCREGRQRSIGDDSHWNTLSHFEILAFDFAQSDHGLKLTLFPG